MPTRPPSPCAHPGCSALTTSGRCAPHQREKEQRYAQQRGTASQRGYDSRWAAYSRWYRTAHPHCVRCQERGVLSPTQQVDHIIPVHGPADPLFWEPTNHQGLCTPCHSSKTVVEDRKGIGAGVPRTLGHLRGRAVG